MKLLKPFSAMVALAMLVGGCNPGFAAQLKAKQGAGEKNAVLRRQAIDSCKGKARYFNHTFKMELAVMMKVPKAEVEDAFCTRLANAVADGRITDADLVKAQRSGNLAAFVRALKGY
jgi:hypothetical protein